MAPSILPETAQIAVAGIWASKAALPQFLWRKVLKTAARLEIVGCAFPGTIVRVVCEPQCSSIAADADLAMRRVKVQHAIGGESVGH